MEPFCWIKNEVVWTEAKVSMARFPTRNARCKEKKAKQLPCWIEKTVCVFPPLPATSKIHYRMLYHFLITPFLITLGKIEADEHS